MTLRSISAYVAGVFDKLEPSQFAAGCLRYYACSCLLFLYARLPIAHHFEEEYYKPSFLPSPHTNTYKI